MCFSSAIVGIGTTVPAAKLDVAGEVKFGNTSSTCNTANEGQQRYNSTSKKMEFCDGTAWTVFGTGGSSGRTSCPAGFSLVGTSGSSDAFCISTNEESVATWSQAVAVCSNKSPASRLCSVSEWAQACVNAGSYGLNNMTNNWEWGADLWFHHVSMAGGLNMGAAVMGSTSCGAIYGFRGDQSYASRCCFR
jgi:hypothetical protein